ncbi:MAG: hypothetical protein ABI609_17070 [Acidobacteriota bacterium]
MSQPDRPRQTAELYELGTALLRQQIRREAPSVSEAEIETRLRRRLMERDGELRLTRAPDLPVAGNR